MNSMKKYLYCIIMNFALCIIFTSCSDMLETGSSRQVFDPELDQKTDSMFYAQGIMQAMQQLADQYYFLGEVRGDMVELTSYANKHIKKLARFENNDDGSLNKYDSAYVYYRVINNCNYYLAHRDTTLMTGAEKVTINEFAAVAAFRAWAYLQLGRLYEKVPYFLEPLTTISQIDNNTYPEYSLEEIVADQTAYLQKFSGLPVPDFGKSLTGDPVSAGTTNWGQNKTYFPSLCFIPVDVILGEMYLEAHDYYNAARSYYTYLQTTETPTDNLLSPTLRPRSGIIDYPANYDESYNRVQFQQSGTQWSNIFSYNSVTDIVTYIPMAVNYTIGTITDVPEEYGYDYYSTDRSGRNCPTIEEIGILPSSDYINMAKNSTFYYYSNESQDHSIIRSAKLGDGRFNILEYDERNVNDTTLVWIPKVRNANVILYRKSTIYLHLAEALNRLGYPDAAFCILRDGLSARDSIYVKNGNESDSTRYIRPDTYAMLLGSASSQYKVPFFDQTNSLIFTTLNMKGIHRHGCGAVDGKDSPYRMNKVVGEKLAQISSQFGVAVSATRADSINAVEDLLCDEYAMEFAFEGSRFYDLARLARHKNASSPSNYGANFGSRWLTYKLRRKNVDFTDPQRWYLPFK